MCNAKQALAKKRSANEIYFCLSWVMVHLLLAPMTGACLSLKQLYSGCKQCYLQPNFANDRIITTSAQLPLISEIFLDWILTETFRQDILDTLFQQEFADFNHRIHSYLESLMYVPFRMKLPALCSLLCFHFLRYSRNCVSHWNLRLRLR